MFMRHCPRTMIMTTSREILRIESEHVYRVPPLEVPAEDVDTDYILDHSAVELFIAREKGLDTDFSPHTHDRLRLPRSAGTWTAYRSPSNLPRRALLHSGSRQWPPDCTTALPC
jgi:hypothetical protein